MSEVEKMYENAGAEKSKCWDDCITCTRTSCDKTISYIKAEYPPFTAEKQLELIKWLARHNFVVCKNLGGWHAGINPTYDEDFGITCNKRVTNLGSFEYALAGLINAIWQDLTEEEKQQVKGILE